MPELAVVLKAENAWGGGEVERPAVKFDEPPTAPPVAIRAAAVYQSRVLSTIISRTDSKKPSCEHEQSKIEATASIVFLLVEMMSRVVRAALALPAPFELEHTLQAFGDSSFKSSMPRCRHEVPDWGEGGSTVLLLLLLLLAVIRISVCVTVWATVFSKRGKGPRNTVKSSFPPSSSAKKDCAWSGRLKDRDKFSVDAR